MLLYLELSIFSTNQILRYAGNQLMSVIWKNSVVAVLIVLVPYSHTSYVDVNNVLVY